MQTVSVRVEDSFFPHFKALLDTLAQSHSVEIIEDEFDYENSYPQSVVVSSVEEVRRRVFEAESRIHGGEFMTQSQYEEEMKTFFKEELGIER